MFSSGREDTVFFCMDFHPHWVEVKWLPKLPYALCQCVGPSVRNEIFITVIVVVTAALMLRSA